MADEFILYHLGSLPIFSHLTRPQLEQVANAVEVQRYEIGSIVFGFGDSAKGMYKFLSGQAELWQPVEGGQPRLLATIGSNQFLNQNALVRQATESATLRVLQPAHVLMISRDGLIDVLAQNPEIQERLPVKIEMPMISPRYDYRPSTPQFNSAPAATQQTLPTPLNVPHARKTPDRVPNANFEAQTTISDSASLETDEIPIEKRLFRSQRPDEVILLDTRRHWWAYVGKAWFPLLIFVAMIWVSSLVDAVAITVAIDGLAFILPGGLMLYFYLEWRNDHLIVTNHRVLHIERTIHTLKSSVKEMSIHGIQEINAEDIVPNDPFSRLWNYGKITLQSAGEGGRIIFDRVTSPQKIQNIIIQHRRDQQHQQEQQHIAQIQADVDRALGRVSVPSAQQQEKTKNEPKTGGNIRTWLGWTKQIRSNGDVIYRKHPIFWWRITWVPMLFTLLSLGALIGSLVIWDALGIVDTLLAFLGVIICGAWLYFADWDWRNDMYVIGDETIQLIHKRPFWLQNENDQVYLERIDNVISEKGGFSQTLFNYGHVRLLLVGADKNDAKVFRYVANPQEVQAEVTKHQDQMRRKKQEEAAVQRRSELTEYLSVYHQTTGSGQQSGQHGIPTIPETNIPSATQTPDSPPTGRNRMRPPNVPRS